MRKALACAAVVAASAFTVLPANASAAENASTPTTIVTDTKKITVTTLVPDTKEITVTTQVSKPVDTDDDDDDGNAGLWGLLGLLGLAGLAGLAGLKKRRDDAVYRSTGSVNADTTPRGSTGTGR